MVFFWSPILNLFQVLLHFRKAIFEGSVNYILTNLPRKMNSLHSNSPLTYESFFDTTHDKSTVHETI